MPNFIGGDITGYSIKHPILGEFRFQVKANESGTVDFGGKRANDDASSITGAGQPINQINTVRWSFEVPSSVDFISGNETKNLPLLAGHPVPSVLTVSHISGVDWKGTGFVVGDLSADTNTAQMTVKMSGGGLLEIL